MSLSSGRSSTIFSPPTSVANRCVFLLKIDMSHCKVADDVGSPRAPLVTLPPLPRAGDSSDATASAGSRHDRDNPQVDVNLSGR